MMNFTNTFRMGYKLELNDLFHAHEKIKCLVNVDLNEQLYELADELHGQIYPISNKIEQEIK
jgi:hypothetical protein